MREMAALPPWFTQLHWSSPTNIASVNVDRSIIPDFPGCYAFTEHNAALIPGRVLYIGQARYSLLKRLRNYLIDIQTPKKTEGHKGKGFVLEARSAIGDQGVYVRWVEYGGNKGDLDILEASLIHFLNPGANDRAEDERHPLLDDNERLDAGLLR
jgi:hypothetical protein